MGGAVKGGWVCDRREAGGAVFGVSAEVRWAPGENQGPEDAPVRVRGMVPSQSRGARQRLYDEVERGVAGRCERGWGSCEVGEVVPARARALTATTSEW